MAMQSQMLRGKGVTSKAEGRGKPWTEDTFLDVAVQNVRKSGLTDPDYINPNEYSLLVAGSTSLGKTTLINKFLFGTDQRITNSTKLLEYYCSPPTSWINDDNYNKTCHVWELEDVAFENSLHMLEKSPKLTAILCLDLSQPQYLYHTQDVVLTLFRKYASWRKDADMIKKDRISQVPKDHPDVAVINPFPLPLIIVGMKYDLFHKFEPEKKRVISQFLRYIAHINGAHFFSWTDRNSEINKQAKGILRHYAYDKEMSTVKKTDHNKALVIPPFSDKMEDIDSAEDHSLEKYRINLETHFPQENPFKSRVEKNPADDPKFAEPTIDLIRSKVETNWRNGP